MNIAHVLRKLNKPTAICSVRHSEQRSRPIEFEKYYANHNHQSRPLRFWRLGASLFVGFTQFRALPFIHSVYCICKSGLHNTDYRQYIRCINRVISTFANFANYYAMHDFIHRRSTAIRTPTCCVISQRLCITTSCAIRLAPWVLARSCPVGSPCWCGGALSGSIVAIAPSRPLRNITAIACV